MARDALTMDQARALAQRMDRQQEAWRAQAEQQAEDTHLECHYDHLTTTAVVGMWGAQQNEDGKALSRFELRALVAQWCKRFGDFPPSDVTTPAPPASEPAEPEAPTGNAMMTRGDVAKKLRTHVNTIQRMEKDGRLPKPVRMGKRGRRHLARDVDAYIARLEQQRDAPRVER